MGSRENNYDLLRILCMIGVILIHVSATYLNNEAVLYNAGNYNGNQTIWISLFNCIGRFAVPCFLMLTGALLLNNPKNREYKYFYKKMINRIVMPTILFTIIYFLYRVIISLFGNGDIISIIKDTLKGKVFYHMWYMYMLFGVYLFIPIIIRFKDDIGEKKFKIVSIIFLPLAVLCLWISKFNVEWNVAKSFLELSYVMIGYIIANHFINKKYIYFWIFFIIGLQAFLL